MSSSKWQKALAGLVLVSAFCACQLPVEPASPATIEHLAQAMRQDAWSELNRTEQAVMARGKVQYMGQAQSFELLLAGDGRYRTSISGDLGKLEVFDGARVYRRDFSGVGRELFLSDRASAPLMAEVLSGNWARFGSVWQIAQGDFEVRAEEGWLRVKTESGLPRSMSSGNGKTAIQFSKWQAVEGAGVKLPRMIESGVAEEGSVQMRYEVDSAVLWKLNDESFAFEEGVQDDFTFAVGADAIEAQRLPTGHLLVRPLLQGQDVGWFLLDTGAGSAVLDLSVVEQLDLQPVGEVRAVGVAGSTPASFVRAGELELGALTWRDPLFVALDFGGISTLLGVEVAGVLGYGIFSRAVVEIGAEAVVLREASRFSADPDWPQLDLVFEAKSPCARASFPTRDGDVEAWFRLDTGADGTVTFHTPAVKRYGLLANRETTPAAFGGVGGSQFGFYGQLDWFELGGRRMEDLEVGFATGDEGTFGAAHLAGNIGHEVFKGALLVFDYSRGRLHLAPDLNGR